jgi:uncharacterized protein (DUF58 family)
LASDFQDNNFEKQLRITNQKHDLVSIIINDELEDELPDIGLVKVRDAETGVEKMVDTSSSKVRKAYRIRRMEQKAYIHDKMLKMKIDAVEVETNKSYVQPLMNFFKRRGSRY